MKLICFMSICKPEGQRNSMKRLKLKSPYYNRLSVDP
jgi:hypothetical protein